MPNNGVQLTGYFLSLQNLLSSKVAPNFYKLFRLKPAVN
jgi:hypothetical protein